MECHNQASGIVEYEYGLEVLRSKWDMLVRLVENA